MPRHSDRRRRYHDPGVPRRFWLTSKTPASIVAEGTQFSSGAVSVCWPGCDTAIQDATSLETILTLRPDLDVLWLDRDRILDRCIT
jgi:hypothetical protein